jgi:hypothetical protein
MARVFDLNGNVWFHDGRTSGDACDPQGQLVDFDSNKLSVCDCRKAVLALYART